MSIVRSSNRFSRYYQRQRPYFRLYCWQMICNYGMKKKIKSTLACVSVYLTYLAIVSL